MIIERGIDRPLWQRLLWFVALWGAGVITVASVAYFIRWWIV